MKIMKIMRLLNHKFPRSNKHLYKILFSYICTGAGGGVGGGVGSLGVGGGVGSFGLGARGGLVEKINNKFHCVIVSLLQLYIQVQIRLVYLICMKPSYITLIPHTALQTAVGKS